MLLATNYSEVHFLDGLYRKRVFISTVFLFSPKKGSSKNKLIQNLLRNKHTRLAKTKLTYLGYLYNIAAFLVRASVVGLI